MKKKQAAPQELSAQLIAHPQSEGVFVPVFRLDGTLSREQSLFSFEFKFQGDIQEILIPTVNPSKQRFRRCDELWKHTCFEAFICLKESSSYWELNASPSGDWNFYLFDEYRSNRKEETRIQPSHFKKYAFDLHSKTFKIVMDLASILAFEVDLRVGLTAVLEKQDQQKAYFALTHLTSQPDFHLKESFLLRS